MGRQMQGTKMIAPTQRYCIGVNHSNARVPTMTATNRGRVGNIKRIEKRREGEGFGGKPLKSATRKKEIDSVMSQLWGGKGVEKGVFVSI